MGRSNERQRVAVVARLRSGSRERAAEIVGQGPPYELVEAGFERHSIYLSDDAVVFVFEGPGIDALIRELVNDPVRSAAFGIWGPLLEGAPAIAHEEFYWAGDVSW
jgi:hypothetical protein